MIEATAPRPAGTGSPVPAESSAELVRIRRRFTELTIDDARTGMHRARPLLDLLTDRLGQPPVPDLGPAVVPDQLTVLVYDVYAVAAGADATADLPAHLADLRRAL